MNPMHYAEVSTTAPGKHEEVDIESGELLYPGISKGENQLRWGFIRKVYGILSAQLLLTTAISFVTVLYTPVNDLLKGSPAFSCSSPSFLSYDHILSHDPSHVWRVRDLALSLARQEQALSSNPDSMHIGRTCCTPS